MPDGRTALTGAERKRRYDRRVRHGSIYFRGDLPLDICELLMDYGYKAADDSTDPDEWGAALVEAFRGVMHDNK